MIYQNGNGHSAPVATQEPDNFLAPHSVEAEEAVLGAVLLNPDVMLELADYLDSDSFFVLRNSWVWDALNDLSQRGEMIDYLTITEELKSKKRLNEIGGSAYITYLINNTPTHLNFDAYGRVVERAYKRRKLLAVAGEIAQYASSSEIDATEAQDRAHTALFDAIDDSKSDSDVVSFGDALADFAVAKSNPALVVKKTVDGKTVALAGHSTGLIDLDYILKGLKPDFLYALTGVTGLGKTSLALDIGRKVAESDPHPAIGSNIVVIFSLEMSPARLIQRYVANEAKINSHKLQTMDLTDDERKRYTKAINDLAKLSEKIILVDARHYTVTRMIRKAEQIRRKYGKLGLIITDYLGEFESELNPNTKKAFNSRAEEVKWMARQHKNMASVKDGKYNFGCPVIMVTQVNRETSKSGKPSLFGFSDSSGIEKSIDCAIMIYQKEDDPETVIRVAVPKHRDGPVGECQVMNRKESYFWGNLAVPKTSPTQPAMQPSERERLAKAALGKGSGK